MPVLIAITVATLVGGGFLITTDPGIVAANEAKITASSTAQVKLEGGLNSLQLKFNNWYARHSTFAHKASGTKATGTKATSTKIKIRHDAGVEGKIQATENFIASVRHFLEVHGAEISAEVEAGVDAKLDAAASLLAEARAKLEADAQTEAETLVRQAMSIAKEAKGMVHTEIRAEAKVKKCLVLLSYPPQIRCH